MQVALRLSEVSLTPKSKPTCGSSYLGAILSQYLGVDALYPNSSGLVFVGAAIDGLKVSGGVKVPKGIIGGGTPSCESL